MVLNTADAEQATRAQARTRNSLPLEAGRVWIVLVKYHSSHVKAYCVTAWNTMSSAPTSHQHHGYIYLPQNFLPLRKVDEQANRP